MAREREVTPRWTSGTGTARPAAIERSPKIAELVARSLADYIIDNDLEPGDSLPNEREMSEWFDTGRATLREALRLLETQGIIMIRSGPGGGPVVREQRPYDLVSSMTLILQLMRATLDQVVDARIALEPSITRVAAERRGPEHVTALAQISQEMLDNVNDPAEMRSLYNQFHWAMGEATDNSLLMIVKATLQEICAIYEAEVVVEQRDFKATAELHKKLAERIAEQDSDGAEALTNQHLDAYRNRFLSEHRHLIGQRIRWNW